MSQSRWHSFVEANANTFIGFWVNIVIQLVVYPWFGATFTFEQNIHLGLIFLAVSLVRGYLFRRYFNDLIHKGLQ